MKHSAGILLYRYSNHELQVLLAHPGGPFWSKKDAGVWTIPKGEIQENEIPLAAARREFMEETGMVVSGEYVKLTPLLQPSNQRIVHAWALLGNFNPRELNCNNFSMEWPKGSGKYEEFPEIDRVEWFNIAEASNKILRGQRPFLTELQDIL